MSEPKDREMVSSGRRAPRWMVIALVISVAANLLVVGVFIGASIGRDRDDGRRLAREVARLPFVAALEPADRREVIGAMRRDGGGLREPREALRTRFEAFLAELRKDEFDRAAVARLLAEQRGAAAAGQAAGEAILLDHMAGMSAEARRAYADRLDRSLRRR
jgi:uncharacterized membrane protein